MIKQLHCYHATQSVSLLALTAEIRVQTLASPCRICGGQSNSVTGFFSLENKEAFPRLCHSIIVQANSVVYQGDNNLGMASLNGKLIQSSFI